MANEVRIRTSVKDESSKPLKDLHDAWDRLGSSAGRQGVIMGASAAITAKGFDLVGGAVSDVVGWLGESVKAGMEEESSVARMTTALKANVVGWNGSTEAIDRQLQSRMRLAFSDDDLRNSFTKLVAATHDVNKAFDVQNVAMDLARFKGISLGDASDALIKVEGGQFRALKALGIVLKDGATQTEALAAVEKVAAGQAAAFADTTAGKTEVVKNKFEQLQETVGQNLIPVVDKASDAFIKLSGAMDGTSQNSAVDLVSGLSDLGSVWEHINPLTAANAAGMERLAAAQKKAADEASASSGELLTVVGVLDHGWADMSSSAARATGAVGDARREVVADMRTVAASEQNAADAARYFAKVTADSARTVEDKWHDLEDAARTLRDDLAQAGSDAAEALYGPIEDRAHLNDVKGQIADMYAKAKKEHRSLTNAERGDLARLRSDLLDTQVKLAAEGKLTSRELDTLIHKLQTQAQKSTGAAKAYIDELIRKLLALKGVGKSTGDSLNWLQLNTGRGTGQQKQAVGGPASPYGTSIVGENGPEIVHWGPGAGYVDPSASTGSGGGGTSLTISVSTPVLTPGAAQALADAIAPHVTRWQQARRV